MQKHQELGEFQLLTVLTMVFWRGKEKGKESERKRENDNSSANERKLQSETAGWSQVTLFSHTVPRRQTEDRDERKGAQEQGVIVPQ